MSAPYTYSLLRYIHDVVGGEFVNVGVALYSPIHRYIGALCTRKYARLSDLFIHVDGHHFRTMMNHLEHEINQLQRTLEGFQFEEPAKDISAMLRKVLPPDDSSIQFSELRGGLTNDPEITLGELFDRYIGQYERHPRRGRSDDEVWRAYRHRLREANVDHYLSPYTVRARDYEYEFGHCWENGRIKVAEAVSFDLADSNSIKDKANKWLGRLVSLEDAEEPFMVYFLLGKPRQPQLRESFVHAKNILHKSPVDLEFIGEDEALQLAEIVRIDLGLTGS